MGRKHRRKTVVRKAEPAGPAAVSPRWRFFVWMSSFFAFATLFLRLDVITAWPGAEGWALGAAVFSDSATYFPVWLAERLLPLGESFGGQVDRVWLPARLVSAVAMLATAIVTYLAGRRLFGREATTLGLLCAAASLYLPFFGKVATGDALALLGHTGLYFLGLLYLLDTESKRPPVAAVACGLLGAVVAPVATILIALALLLADRSTGRGRWIAVGLLVACVGSRLLGDYELFRYTSTPLELGRFGRFLGYCLLGSAPIIGWLFAGLRDLVYKVRRGEQAGRLLAVGLGLSLLAQSLLFPLLLAFVAGKQMQLYFRSDIRYPWGNYVKTGSVLHLITAFIGAFLALAGGAIAFPGAGFRAGLGMVAAYWIFSLFGVLGIFGERRDFALGGSLLSGLLAALFFWVQVYPYFELERAWPKQLVRQLEGSLGAGAQVQVDAQSEDASALSVAVPYLLRAGFRVDPVDGPELRAVELEDSTVVLSPEVDGRIVFGRRRFGLAE